MRVLLDAHLSDEIVGETLRRAGHDVRALASEHGLEGIPDSTLLELALADERVTVTGDLKDFSALVRARGRTGRAHAGCLILTRIGNREQGELGRAIASGLSTFETQDAWIDKVVFVSRPRE